MQRGAKVESQRLRNGKLAADDWPRLTAACDKLAKAPIYVDDTGSITMMEIRSKARRLKSKEPNRAIVVDYIQLDDVGRHRREPRPGGVADLAEPEGAGARPGRPRAGAFQLSRAVEQRHDKRPILSDPASRGLIEQDADLVFFIYRDEYYNDETDQQGIAEIHSGEAPERPDRHGEGGLPEPVRSSPTWRRRRRWRARPSHRRPS